MTEPLGQTEQRETGPDKARSSVPPPLRTLLVDLEKDFGTAQEQVLALAELLLREGCHAPLVCCPAGSGLALRAQEQDIPCVALAGLSPRHPLSLFRLWRVQERARPLLIHSFGSNALALGWILWRLRRTGSTALLHSCFAPPAPEAGAVGESRAWQAAEKIICAHAGVRTLLADAGLTSGRLTVVHPGRDLTLMPARCERSDGRIAFVAAEELVSESGLFVLLRAMAALWQRDDLPPWEVRVVGEGPQFDALLDEARTLGVEARLALLSRQALVDVFPYCDALLVPNRQVQGNMGTIMAGWCCGLPIVCSDAAPHLEIVQADRTALVVPQGNAQALAAAMIRIMGEKDLREHLVAGGESMRSYVDLARMAKQCRAIYADCVGRHGWVIPPPRPPDALEENTVAV